MPWLLLGLLTACSVGAPPETLAALRIDAPASVEVGGHLTVVVTAIGSRGTEPLPGYSATIALEVDDGRVSPDEFSMSSGSGNALATFTRVVAPITLTARIGTLSASTSVDVLPLTELPGDDSASAASRVPFIGYRPRPHDYTTDAPDLPGPELSFNTVTTIIDPAATVRDVNGLLDRYGAAIVGAVPGIDGAHGPVVALRLPTTDHAAMLAALTALTAEAIVVVAHREHRQPEPAEPEESLVSRLAIPDPNSGEPPGWTWELEEDPQPELDANWGLERIRVPQMWNLNAVASRAGRVPVGVLDSGFSDHPDLDFVDRQGEYIQPIAKDNDHGLHVSGTIGATFRNGKGVDGINPFPGLIARRYGEGLGWGMVDFIEANPGMRVVNASLGENWYRHENPVNPAMSASVQAHMDAQGQTFAQFLGYLSMNGVAVPLIVAAAGNDSGHAVFANAVIDARWSSPVTNAGVRNLTPHVLVVEAVGRGGDGSIAKASFSNAPGTIAAPGVDIWSTAASLPYMPKQGTSMAAPHVAGVASFLFTLSPELTNAEVKEALVSTAEAVPGGTAPLIDAFAAAVALDIVAFGTPRVLRWLVDIDDGTLDGNARTTRAVDLNAETDGMFGPVGDGRIDMRDFRRWRDWLLQIEAAAGLALDGAADHPKKDPNGNRVPGEDPKIENTFPRGDFNGDGVISRVLTSYVGGAVNAEVSDLDMLKMYFADQHYGVDDLDDLINSGDLEIWPATLFERADVASVVTSLRAEGRLEVLDQRTHTRAVPRHVYTLSTTPGVYAATATARDAGGQTVATAEETFVVALGSDTYWDPGADIVVPATNVYLRSSSVHIVATASVIQGESDDQQDSFESVTEFSGALSASAAGTCGGYPGVDEVSGTVTSNVTATYALRMGDETDLLQGFGGENHHTGQNFRYESHGWERWCGYYRSNSNLLLEFEVVGGDVLMHVMSEYDADPGPSEGGVWGAVRVFDVARKTDVFYLGPSAPASVKEKYVLSPGNYRLSNSGAFTESTRIRNEGNQTVGHRFDISFTTVDE